MREFEEMRRIFNVALGREEAEEESLRVYGDLVYTRMEETLSSSFPLFKRFTGDRFGDLVALFVKERHRSPLLMDLPGEFLEFFRSADLPLKASMPFLEDLLLYEWAELKVFWAEDPEVSPFSWEGRYELSPTAVLGRFSFPVHRADRLEAEELLRLKGSYHLLVYRDPEDLEVKTVELTEFVYEFLEKIQKGAEPLNLLTEKIPKDLDPREVKNYMERFLGELCSKGILVSRNVRRS
jgi:hypothetical protein